MFTTIRSDHAPEVTAADGSTVRQLCVLPGVATFARSELAPGQVSHAVSHASVQEVWYVISGGGRMWRHQDGHEEITELEPGVCLTIPLGTRFQFRGGPDGLHVIAITAPPWPDSPDEAQRVHGPW